MPPEFQNCSHKTKKTNLQPYSDYRSWWSKEPQWENDCGSFLPCFLLVIVARILEKALQVGVADSLDQLLEELVSKKETKTQGGGGYVKPIYIQRTITHGQKIISNKFNIFLRKRTTLCTCSPSNPCIYPLLITLYELGDGEPAPYEPLTISFKVNHKLVLHLPDRPCGVDYVVGGGVHDVLGGIVIHHGGVVTGGPYIVGAPYHGGVLVPKYGFQHLQVLVHGGVS
jgi:hypothetical protein